MLTIIATLYPKPQHLQALLEVCRDDATHSVKDEPGCRRFEVFYDVESPNELILIEVYDDDAAFQAHLKTPHFARFAAGTKGKYAQDPKVVRCVNVYPSDAVFKAAKKK